MLGTRRGQSTRAAATAALTGAAVAAALVTGCGTARAGEPAAAPHGASRAPGTRTARAGPVAGSAQEAQRLADWLVSHLILPAGSRRIPWHPAPTAEPAPAGLGPAPAGIPIQHQADARGLWLVPTSPTALAGFTRAHQPSGLRLQGSSQVLAGGQVAEEVTTFALRRVPAGIELAQLSLEITPGGRNLSRLSADAEVTWYPRRSAGEYLVPARFRAVTVAAGYLSPKPHTVRRTFTSPAVIARLARLLNSLPATPGGLTGCPMVSSTYAVTFRYSAGARPYLTASDSGCGTVEITINGRPQPGLADQNALITRVVQAALAGHPGSIAPLPGPMTPPPIPWPRASAPVPVVSPPTTLPPAGPANA